MVSPLHDTPVIQYHDHIRIFNRGKPVGNHKHCPSLHQLVHTFLNDFLRPGVNAGSSFIQDQYRGICHRHPCDRQELPLSLGKAAAAALQDGLVPVRKFHDKFMGIGQLCRSYHLFLRGIQLSIPDIIHHRPRK